MHGLQLLANPNPQLAVVDLGLFAGPGLESNRRQLRPFALGPMGLEIALELLITASEPQARQLAVQHHSIPPYFRPAPRNKVGELIDGPPPRPRPTRLPTAQSEPAPDRFAIHPKFARDPLDPFAT